MKTILKVLFLNLLFFLLVACEQNYVVVEKISSDLDISRKYISSTKENYLKNNFKVVLDSSGHILKEYFMCDSLLNGQFTEYYSNGNIRNILNFNKGLKHGIFYHYDKKGQLSKEVYYLNDSLILGKYRFKDKTKKNRKSFKCSNIRNNNYQYLFMLEYDESDSLVNGVELIGNFDDSKKTKTLNSLVLNCKTYIENNNFVFEKLTFFLGDLNADLSLKDTSFYRKVIVNSTRLDTSITYSVDLQFNEYELFTGKVVLDVRNPQNNNSLSQREFPVFYQVISQKDNQPCIQIKP